MLLHIIISAIVLVVGLYIISDIDKEWTWLAYVAAIGYFLLAPYGHKEEIRNCQTEKGYTVSVIVEFKEPIIKLIFPKPKDVKVTSINGQKCEIELYESSNKAVYKGTVFVGGFGQGDERNTLQLIL